MIAYAKQLTASKFVRNVAIVATGTAGAQAITMAFAPIITRLYGPEAFGVLGTYTAILGVLAPLAALSYPIAIVLPKRDADAIGLATLSLGIAVVMSLLAALILLLFKAPIVNAFNLQAVEPFILLLPLAMLFSAAMAIMSQWVIRKKLFKIKAKVAVLQALWLNSAKAGIGLFSPLAAVLVVLATVGSALHALMLWTGVRKSSYGRMVLAKQEDNEPIASAKALAWRHRDFAYYRTPQVFIDALSQGMPIFMLASFTSPAAAGFYSLGRMVLGLPTSLIGKAIADVFYPKINEISHAGDNVTRLIVKATFILGLIGAIPFGIVMAFGPWLFAFVFGAEWEVSGEYARWLSVWLFFAFCNRPSVASIPVLRLQGLHLLINVIGFFLRVAALMAGFVIYDSPLVAVMLFSLVYAVMNITLIFLVIKNSVVV